MGVCIFGIRISGIMDTKPSVGSILGTKKALAVSITFGGLVYHFWSLEQYLSVERKNRE